MKQRNISLSSSIVGFTTHSLWKPVMVRLGFRVCLGSVFYWSSVKDKKMRIYIRLEHPFNDTLRRITSSCVYWVSQDEVVSKTDAILLKM